MLVRAGSTRLIGRIQAGDTRIVLARSARVTYTIPAVGVEASSTLRSLCHACTAFRARYQGASKAKRESGRSRSKCNGIASGFTEPVLQEAVPLEVGVGQLESAEVGVGCIWRIRNVHNQWVRNRAGTSEEGGAPGEVWVM